jgi:hypothetical protein
MSEGTPIKHSVYRKINYQFIMSYNSDKAPLLTKVELLRIIIA